MRLVVLRHGRQNVLAAIARLVEQSPEQLEQQLQALGQKQTPSRRKGPKPSLVELAASECRDRAEIMEPIRALAVAFDNRSFLPNLRDVARFLDRFGAPSQKLKSRAVAGPVVIRALCKLPMAELTNLAARDALGRESDYALLTRAIMGEPSGDKAD
ncbi:MAG: hypothetical protein WAM29_15945 [Methylocella sp.]